MEVNSPDQVKGHIYLITNSISGKKYVGQTVSHRLNKGKYKPFGYEGRFKDHISEALCNTKKKQCSYLNNAIRKDGKESFTCSLILECSKDELDEKERMYIAEYNSLYPTGYNLTAGGKGAKYIKTSETVTSDELNAVGKRGGCKERTEETRKKISTELKRTFGQTEVREELMKRTQEQHLQQKIDRFKELKIDTNNLDKYIKVKSSNGNKFIVVKVGTARTSFVGKMEQLEILKERAINFLKQVSSAT